MSRWADRARPAGVLAIVATAGSFLLVERPAGAQDGTVAPTGTEGSEVGPTTPLAGMGPAAGEAGVERVAAHDGGFGLGREALPEEVASWDIDVRPDGQGLPEGSGDVWTGEEVYTDLCSSCHGDFGEGIGRWPVLMGGDGTLDAEDPVKTVGSYWPYLSTVYDYVHRAMPFGAGQTMTDDEVYAVTAYILYLNALVEDDFVLDRGSLAAFEMPNAGAFSMDDRAETELEAFSREPCMEGCAEDVEITMHATVLDVTPETEGGEEVMDEAAGMAEEQGSNLVESGAEIGTEAGGDNEPEPEAPPLSLD